jgi:hypothetical protein
MTMPDDNADPNAADPKRIAEIIREKMESDDEFLEGEEMFKRRKRLGGMTSTWRTPDCDLSREFDGRTAFKETKDKGTPYDI